MEDASSEVGHCIKSFENHLLSRASSTKDIVKHLKKSIMPILSFAAKTAAASAQTLAPLLGTKRAHNRIETRKNEQLTYDTRKKPSLQMVDTYIHKKCKRYNHLVQPPSHQGHIHHLSHLPRSLFHFLLHLLLQKW